MIQTLDRVDEQVVNHPFLSVFNPHYHHYFTGCANVREFARGEEIFHQDDAADQFYLVLSGRVDLETFVPGRGMVTIQSLGPGEALGWSWLFAPHRWHFTSSAGEPTELIAFDAGYLLDKAEENRDFANELVTRVAGILLERLNGTRLQLIDLYSMRP